MATFWAKEENRGMKDLARLIALPLACARAVASVAHRQRSRRNQQARCRRGRGGHRNIDFGNTDCGGTAMDATFVIKNNKDTAYS